MAKVKRYSPPRLNAYEEYEMVPSTKGEYVSASDYDALLKLATEIVEQSEIGHRTRPGGGCKLCDLFSEWRAFNA